jgi:hypothetical protein
MLRKSCVLLLAIVTVIVARTDLSACGDKFLRVGRSVRIRGYASVHPSSILVYAPRWTPHGIAEFEQILKRGGHKPVTVTNSTALAHAFAGARYDVVITDYSDAGTVRNELDTLPTRPALLPVVYKASKTEAAEAAASYQCLLKPEKMTTFQALEEIDRLIDLRLKHVPAASTR